MIALFIFYNESIGKAAKFSFSKEIAHVSTITYQGDAYVFFDSNTKGHEYRILKEKKGDKIMRNITRLPEITRIVAVNIAKPVRFRWMMFGVTSCNEFARHLTGIDLGLTLNPRHFYTKLLQYNSKRNYEIIYWWRRRECEMTKETTAKTKPIA